MLDLLCGIHVKSVSGLHLVLVKKVAMFVQELVGDIFEGFELGLTVDFGDLHSFLADLIRIGSLLYQIVNIHRLNFFLGLNDCLDAFLLKNAYAFLK